MEIGTNLDLFIIILYFVVVLGFGSFFGRYTKSTSDFFFSGQKLSWWLCAFSCIATVVGSYSFIKYSDVAYRFGFSATMAYTNDWFMLPLWFLGWLPIIYFSNIRSIPEYFEKRFNRSARVAATVIILVFLIGYVGINFYTLGVAMNAILGWGIYESVFIISAICAVYVTAGGQTAVIMTDLLQGFLLLIAGFALFYLGVQYLGGWNIFWEGLPKAHKYAFSNFNDPAAFHSVGIFWQDGFGSTLGFYFMNQGLILRFLSLKSVKEGHKAVSFIALILMPITAIAVANAGWIGQSMVTHGILPPDTDSKKIFVIVANMVSQPGVFGVIMAALTAALMSTVDTLINAISSIFVNDIWQPYVKKDAPDKHYLNVARMSSVFITFLGIALVPLFKSFKSIYEAHGAFTAAITPAMLVTIILGITWKRFNAKSAMWTIVGGSILMSVSIYFPHVIAPLAHGVSDEGGFKYMRALYGLSSSFVVAIIATFLTKPQDPDSIIGYTIWSLNEGRQRFKGGTPNEAPSKPIQLKLSQSDKVATGIVLLSPMDAKNLNATAGDIIFVTHRKWWWGGLKSFRAKLDIQNDTPGEVFANKVDVSNSQLIISDSVQVERII